MESPENPSAAFEWVAAWANPEREPEPVDPQERLAQLLVRYGWITPAQLDDARRDAASSDPPASLGALLISRGLLHADQLRYAVCMLGGDSSRRGLQRIGRYEILGTLGQGGMGVVYRAVDPTLRREVALKVLPPDQDRDDHARRRLLREATAIARLRHKNIVAVHEFGEVDRDVFLAMELVEGPSLDEALPGSALRRKIEILHKVAGAVAYAHEHGVVHRDLKPANVKLTADGEPKVMDFGLARVEGEKTRLTMTGAVMGTPAYMAPEQVRGEKVGTRADVYALGVMLYEALTGLLPFQANDLHEAYQKILNEEPIRPRRMDPKIPVELEIVCLKAMEKDAVRRYATAGELADDLERWLKGEPIRARPATWTTRVAKRVKRNPWAWVGMAGAAVAVVGGVLALGAFSVLHARKTQALHEYDKAKDHLNAALTAALTGQGDPAVDFAQFEAGLAEAVRLDPAFSQGWFERAQYWRVVGDEGRARANLAEGFRREPEHPKGRLERGLLAVADYDRELSRARREAATEEAMVARTELRRPRAIMTADVERRNPDLARLRQAAAEDIRMGMEEYRGMSGLWVNQAMARFYYAREEYDEAAQRLEHLVYPWAKVMLGRVEEARDRPERAEELYDVATRVDSTYWEAWEALGAVRATLGNDLRGRGDPGARARVEAALEAWSRVVDGEPERIAAWLGRSMASYTLGHILRDMGEDPTSAYERAIADVETARETGPTSLAVDKHRGAVYWSLGQWQALRGINPSGSYALAIESYASALERNPEDPHAYSDRGGVFAALGEWQALHGLNPSDSFSLAIESHTLAAERNPEYAEALSGQGRAYAILGQWQASRGIDPSESYARAIESHTLALERNPEYAYACASRGVTYAALGQWQASRGIDPSESYTRAIESSTASLERNPEYAYAYVSRGVAYAALGEWQASRGTDPSESHAGAIESFASAIGRNPEDADAYNMRGASYTRLGEWQGSHGTDPSESYARAVESIASAIERNPTDARSYNNLGGVYTNLGKWEASRTLDASGSFLRAIEAYDAALAINANQWEAHANKGVVYWAMSRWPDAVAEFEAALAINPTLPQLRAYADEARRRAAESAPEY